MSNVKLAIRVRPFTEKELRSEKDRVAVVGVLDENTVTITNIKVSLSGAGDSRERIRRYHADYTFNSSCPVTQSANASQEKVFECIGRSVISSVSQGCSACVLAYGQSATGKTHTMLGTEAQPGLIPRICKALYEQQSQTSEYTISFLEIYNERVHDLLCAEAALPPCHSLPRRKGNAWKDLRVREHPLRGTYVQNLRRVAVHNPESLLSLVAEGVKRRRTAATKRNSTSSRSHALLEIATPHATLHLADLAGSEKASWEGCGGGRQKEGANINKSLVALSNVISALVNGGLGRGKFVPYRDSALTWLLKDCFTGGANTFIIATLSPSAACYGESASTLRWAARARQLPTPRATNTNTNIASRAALQAQFNQLISELTRNHIRYIPETGKITFDEQHWKVCENNSEDNVLTKVAKIGNIMNIMRPKVDANSESTASSVASGSSDVINTMDKNVNITNEINEEMDKLFGATLERTSSGDDLKMVAPLRHKKRQYRSQEVLAIAETSDLICNQNLTNNLPSHSELQIGHLPKAEKQKVSPITILHDNQRAEIVASVTERLYTKLKKKEESAVSKVESIVDKKIVEPLSELKICTNARQRLMDLSQKAIRHRRRIGIPAHTQTKRMVTRVKDQAIDVQTDLHSYIPGEKRSLTLHRDAATETVPMTPRCKEIAVGPNGALNFSDRSTGMKPIISKSSFMMTEIVAKSERCTQTQVLPLPRRKKHTINPTTCICKHEARNLTEECAAPPVISINISHTYPVDSESQTSDDNSANFVTNNKIPIIATTPDLLTNHSTTDEPNIDNEKDLNVASVNVTNDVINPTSEGSSKPIVLNRQNEDFPDTDDLSLPRVSPNAVRKVNQTEIKNMILGRNQNIYPYNIVLSPLRERDTKRFVTFKDIGASQTSAIIAEPKLECDTECDYNNVIFNNENREVSVSDNNFSLSHKNESTYSDSTESSKGDTGSFIWKKGEENNTLDMLRSNHVPVYKKIKYETAKAKVLKDFLRFEESDEEKERTLHSYKSSEDVNDTVSSSDSQETVNISVRQCHRRKPHVNNKLHKTNKICQFQSIERNLFESCDNIEESVRRYENYLANYKETVKTDGGNSAVRRPKDFLQHLVQLRREVVRAESDNTDSSMDVLRE
ncbi:unnamed protein product [Arctia plantaginis]|uniref:Kinesin motor domain-containing protein n=1 Tax=Arctia plantaginis TaxID=874455 RepID=A0A8S1ARR0_ARCPL|nr:unnamed protein product [Arctia plantaginis]